jgi:surface polysaccharide O-acyltransferase-like enzyme
LSSTSTFDGSGVCLLILTSLSVVAIPTNLSTEYVKRESINASIVQIYKIMWSTCYFVGRLIRDFKSRTCTPVRVVHHLYYPYDR